LSEPEVVANFTDYPFHPSIFKDIQAARYETPTPIQAACIPPALEGKDLIGLAQTGTGKTAAFTLPIIHRLAQTAEMGALVLAPTRELAQQISRMFDDLGHSSGIRVATVVGGIPIEKDWKALVSWPNVLVATPGRLIDHIDSGNVDLRDIKVFVVDEADRMHDMGFIPQITKIISHLPAERQTMMFTATMPSDVEQIARRHMRSPERIQVGRRSTPPPGAEQQVFRTNEEDKGKVLLHLLEETEGRVLVFVRTKRGVDRVARIVRGGGHNPARIHSDRAQTERTEAMGGFREGKYRILVATDIAARGLDIADIEHVINYDFPLAAEDYVHRVGRTARVDATGLATSFVTRSDQRLVAAVERLVGAKLPLLPSPVAASGQDGNGHDERRPSRGGRGHSPRGSGRPRSSGSRPREHARGGSR